MGAKGALYGAGGVASAENNMGFQRDPKKCTSTRHASRRLALPTAAVFKPYARRQAVFPAPIKIHLSMMQNNVQNDKNVMNWEVPYWSGLALWICSASMPLGCWLPAHAASLFRVESEMSPRVVHRRNASASESANRCNIGATLEL